MDRATYSLAAGVALLLASIIFFILPPLLDIESFLPRVAGLVSLGSAIIALASGFGAGGRAR